MADQSGDRERRTEEQLFVRQVTHIQASWSERERGAPGAFTIQLILDHGADEFVLRPTADDAEVLLRLFEMSSAASFDSARKVVIFSDLEVS
jgi:hypothetical protein